MLERTSKKKERAIASSREELPMEKLREHYDVERSLASQLRTADKKNRKRLYSDVYNELYRRVPHHPQLVRARNRERQAASTYAQIKFLKPFLDKSYTFLEVGAGDCHLSFEVSEYVWKVYAVDVSDQISDITRQPKNFQLILSDGTSINLPPESVNVAFSNQLMEHLHPDDALDQLQNIYHVLTPGGIYICATPHRFMGPSDISKYFDDVPTGLHLKEYTNTELYRLFKVAGFSKIQSLRRLRKVYRMLSLHPFIMLEHLIGPFPFLLRRKVSNSQLLKYLLPIRLIARK